MYNKSKSGSKDTRYEDFQKKLVQYIVDNLDQGFLWKPGWNRADGGLNPYSLVRGTEYSGLNALMLWCVADDKTYSTNGWLTFNDAKKLEGNVKKGEHGVPCFRAIFKPVEREVCDLSGKPIKNEDGTTKTKKVSEFKGINWFTLFNYDQCENLPPLDSFKTYNERVFTAGQIPSDEYMALTEELCSQAFVPVRWYGNKAYYRPSTDTVTIPEKERWDSGQHAFSVATHELSHASGHESRLNRDTLNMFGTEAYAFEELVAELSSSFICAKYGVNREIEESSVAYLKSWSKRIKDTPEFFFKEVMPLANAAYKFVVSECGIDDLAKKHIGDFSTFSPEESSVEEGVSGL